MEETRTRFLASIATQLPVERVAEVHLFPAIRQGGMESGVAVLALDQAIAAEEIAPEEVPDLVVDQQQELVVHAPSESEVDSELAPEPAPTPRRYTVYTARYRHTLKGLDRGKWEVSVTEEADAPLLTVDAVVRGVQRRSGDVDEIVRLTGDEMRAAIAEPVARIA